MKGVLFPSLLFLHLLVFILFLFRTSQFSDVSILSQCEKVKNWLAGCLVEYLTYIRQVFILSQTHKADGTAHLREMSTQLQTVSCFLFFFFICSYNLELTNLGFLIVSYFWWFTSICFSLTRLQASEGKKRQSARSPRAFCVSLQCLGQSSSVAAATGGEGRANSERVTFDKGHHSFLSDLV